jgi:uncharacterized protein GlcG (DUF336 family)
MSVLFRVAVAGFVCALIAPVSAQVVSLRHVSQKMASTIADTALATCESKGYKISVVVVDRSGETIVSIRGDGSSPHTLENARRKAYTAMTFRRSSAEFAKRMETEPGPRQQATLPNVIGIAGGLPIKVGDEVIGGAGVSGSPGVDEPCVQAGLDKVAEQLK